MKVWYPGPAVDAAAVGEAQNHTKLKMLIQPGWNEVPAGPALADALAAGFVALHEPGTEPPAAAEPQTTAAVQEEVPSADVEAQPEADRRGRWNRSKE